MTARDFTRTKTNLKKKENHGIEAKDGALLITDSQQKSVTTTALALTDC